MAKFKRTPFHVIAYPGDLLGKFVHAADALRVAQMWSARWQAWAEVRIIDRDGAGLIGQFDKGELAPEFSYQQHIVFPPRCDGPPASDDGEFMGHPL